MDKITLIKSPCISSEAVLATRQAEGRLCATTINHLVASWRATFTWAYKEELIDVNPTARLKKVKASI